MALTPEQIAADQSYIDQQYGGYYDPTGQYQTGSVFTNGVYNPYANTTVGNLAGDDRNQGILGAAVANGLSTADLSQVLGIPESTITSYINRFQSTNPSAPNYSSDPNTSAMTQLTNMARLSTSNQTGTATPMTQYNLAGGGYATPQQQSSFNTYQNNVQSALTNFYQQHPNLTPAQMIPAGTQFLMGGAGGFGAAGGTPGTGGTGGAGGGSLPAGSAGGSLPGSLPGGGGLPDGGMGAFGSFSSTRGPMPTLATATAPSPYLTGQADDIQRRNAQMLQDALGQDRSAATAVGQYGSSRHGIADGVAAARSADTMQGQLANLYNTDYQSQLARNLQKYGIDMSNYNTQGSQDLTRYGIDTQAALGLNGQNQNFYTQQRQLDQNGQVIGAQLYGQGTQGYLSQGQGVQQIGNTQQQAPWTTLGNASNLYNQYSGFGSQNATTSGGGGANGVLGGAIAGGQLANNLGLGGGSYGAGGYIPNTSMGLPDLNGNFGNYSFG